MHRTSTRPLVAAALVCLLAALAVPGPATGSSASAPELSLFTLPAPGNPLELDRYDPAAPPTVSNLALNVSADQTVGDVTVTVVAHDGLYVDPLVTHVDTLESTSAELVRFVVAARTTGLHHLALEVSSPGVRTKRISLPYLWAPGGPPIPGGGSLAGRMYGHNGLDSYACAPHGSCDFRTSERLVFLDGRRTSDALAVDGTQSCPPRRRCPRYHHDASTGLVQVGPSTIGRVTARSTFVDGERYTRLVYPERGQRLDARWQYGANVDEGRGVVEQRLSLRRDGRFRLAYAVDTHRYPDNGLDTAYSRSLRGRYVIGRNGRIALQDARRGTKVATLALAANGSGRPRASTKGVWLDLAIDPPDGEAFVDGNLLSPLPRSARSARSAR